MKFAFVAIALALLCASSSASLQVQEVNGLAEAQKYFQLEHKKMTCAQCTEHATMIVDIVNNTLLWPQIVDLAEKSCVKKHPNNTKDQKLCIDVVKIAAKIIPDLLHGMEKLAWNIPLTICADIVKVCKAPCCKDATTPEQFHLSLPHSVVGTADNSMSMRLTWVTREPTPGVVVKVWAADGSAPAFTIGETGTRTYTDGGWLGIIHYADIMDRLSPDTTYNYTVGFLPSNFTYKQFSFKTFPANIGTAERPLRMVTIADMGFGDRSTNTINQIAALVEAGQIDMVMHSGDIGYADADEGHWDVFFNKVEPIAARVPYMTVPGNHELYWNFSAYRARSGLSMPSPGPGTAEGAMYYTLRVGTVQMIMLDSETWYDTADINEYQQAWLKTQLQSVDRSKTPWLLTFQHRPLYCSDNSKLQCDSFADKLRSQVENLYLHHGVDLSFAGHMHNWQRSWPTYNAQAVAHNYSQPTAPVYIVDGAAGNREGNGTPMNDMSWCAFASNTVGYSTYSISSDMASNKHELDVKFIRSTDNTVLDGLTITKKV